MIAHILPEFKDPAFGGLILAIASSLHYLLFGRILGMSGILHSLFDSTILSDLQSPSHGVILCAMILTGLLFPAEYLNSQADNTSPQRPTLYLLAGLLVGVGTKLGTGCTSGHGLCGLPRLSLRSFVAVCVFLSTAIVTATFKISSWIPEFYIESSSHFDSQGRLSGNYLVVVISGLLLLVSVYSARKTTISILELGVNFLIGMLFATGLLVGGMVQKSKVHGFLDLKGIQAHTWDPSLLIILMVGVTINLIVFNIVIRVMKRPLFDRPLSNPHGSIDANLIVGAVLFGIGWGLGNMCPGPFFVSLAAFKWSVQAMWLAGFVLGSSLANWYRKIVNSSKKLN